MRSKRATKKKYLRILNKRLQAEPNISLDARFVPYPLGAKIKHATGVTANDTSNNLDRELMAAIVQQASAELVVIDYREVGNG